MLTASIKTSRTKIIGTVSVILALIIGAILFFGSERLENASESISLRVTNNEERKTYLAQKGIETALEPCDIKEVVLPKEDAVFNDYCSMQKEAGFDLSPYLGKKVMKYVYQVLDSEETYVTLYVYNEKIIAADISNHIEGTQKAVDGKENIG